MCTHKNVWCVVFLKKYIYILYNFLLYLSIIYMYVCTHGCKFSVALWTHIYERQILTRALSICGFSLFFSNEYAYVVLVIGFILLLAMFVKRTKIRLWLNCLILLFSCKCSSALRKSHFNLLFKNTKHGYVMKILCMIIINNK